MTKQELSQAVGAISVRHIREAEIYFEKQAKRKPSWKRGWSIAAIITCFLLLSAFAVPIFSALYGDALTLQATYAGNGVVSLQVENRSDRELRFEPNVKLVAWLTEEEVTPLSETVTFTPNTVPPHSTQTLLLDLSQRYDMATLESSSMTQWYYLVVTNQNFLFGQEWVCSIYFGEETPELSESAGESKALEPEILEKIPEELRFYFLDSTKEIFAANPVHYEYLQKVQEYLQRSGCQLVSPVDAPLMVMPLKSGVVLDESFPLEKQNLLATTRTTSLDAQGKLIGAEMYSHVTAIHAWLPAFQGAVKYSWVVPVCYLATFEAAAANNPESCAFLHGQIVRLEDLKPYQTYKDDMYVQYDITHLFYTDLHRYGEMIYSENQAQNIPCYWDEQVYQRLEAVRDYYQENLAVVPLDQGTNAYPHSTLTGFPENWDPKADGLQGKLESDCDIEEVVFTVYSETTEPYTEGTQIFKQSYVPQAARSYDLSTAKEVMDFIRSLEPGEYSLEFWGRLDHAYTSYGSFWSVRFTIEEVT